MSKLFKKISAIVLTAIMVLTMCSAVFADDETYAKPANTDTATATVQNVEAGATVTAYHIVKGNYNEQGFTGYEAMSGANIADIYNPTDAEITTIAKNSTFLEGLTNDVDKVSMIAGNADANGLASFTAELTAGTWLVLVTESVDEVYNPMVVSVGYLIEQSGDLNKLQDGNVDANSKWEIKGQTAYAKSTKPSLEKTIVSPSSGNTKGDDAAYGDTVNYQIKTAIPSYSKEYEKVKVQVSDTLSTGLVMKSTTSEGGEKSYGKVTVKVDGTEVQETSEEVKTYTIKIEDEGFIIDFDSDYALTNSGKDVVVTYSATVTEGAPYNFDPSTNTGKLTYSNNPKKADETKEVEDKTYHYTFAIDGKLFGNSEEEWNKTTTEITKTGKETKSETWTRETDNGPLAGATFTLTRTDKTGYVYTTTSDDEGNLSFKGLDAGSYNLQETKAPSGYSLNSTVYPVVITAEYNADGTLKNYSIKINGDEGRAFTYTASYNNKIINKIESTTTIGKDTFEIKNTPISGLPSTGGMGTYIFTIVGVVLMACAAGAFMVSRRKSEN